MRTIKGISIVLITLLLFGACSANRGKEIDSKTQTDISSTASNLDSTTNSASYPLIVFLHYAISRDSNGNIQVNLTNKITTNGKLKNSSLNKADYQIGDLKCSELDHNSLPLQSFYVSNPLRRRVEYVNNSGELENKLIELDSAEFFVRVQLNPKTKSIAIEQINDSGKNNRDLIITTIN